MLIAILIVCFTTLKSSVICQRSFQRTMKSSIIYSSQPRSVVVGDFNNDYKIDIAVANSGTNTIGIFLSNGDGTFADQITCSTDSQSNLHSITVGHFNNDNYLDIAIANYAINNISILLGKGNGTFNDQKVFSLGSSHPLFITIADFNNDNQTDLVVVNNGTDNIGILFGYGNGSFQDQITYSTGYDSMTYSLAVDDLNKDNYLDIAVANSGTNNIGIFLGSGNGTFKNQQIYTTFLNSNPTSIAIADINNDKNLDIIVANSGTNNIGMFFGFGNGSFSSQILYLIDIKSCPQYITVGNFNNDNALDIVFVDSINNQMHILLGDGNGSFTILTTYNMMSESNPMWAAVADFNNDNQSDIVIANYGTNNVIVLSNYSFKSSTKQTNYDTGESLGVIAVATSDFNNDYIYDIVCIVRSRILIFIGLENSVFVSAATYSTGYQSAPQYLCVGDLNNDNRTDVITANTGTDNIGVFLGHGNGTFATMTNFSTGIGSSPWWVALGDVNNDNRLDIVSANTGTGTVGILIGNGDGTFATMVTYTTASGSIPYSVAIGDINNDTHLDLVVADGLNIVSILLGKDNGTFNFTTMYPTGNGADPTSIVLADFNDDNHLDIAVANTFNNNIGISIGYGNGTFTSQTTYSTGTNSHPYYVIVADYNYDNINDLIVTNNGEDEIVIFFGYSNGTFILEKTYSTGSGSSPYGLTTINLETSKQVQIIVALFSTGSIATLMELYAVVFGNDKMYSTGATLQPFSISVGDFNNDNQSDIVVANSGTDNLALFFGSSNGTFVMETTYSLDIDYSPQYVITCDIDKNNQTDIISVNSGNDSISIIMGYGNGSFAKQMIYSVGDRSNPYAIVLGDFNNDDRFDFVTANEGSNTIGLFYGFDYTSFQTQETYSSNSSLSPHDIIVHDFNNDNCLDIAVVFSSSNHLGILLGYCNGSFSNIMIYTIGTSAQPTGICVGDFNNDNQSDIIVVNWAASNIVIFVGYGNGSFYTLMMYSTGNSSNPIAAASGDFNNDNRLDIVVANYGSGNIAVLLGYGNATFSTAQLYSTGTSSSPYDVTVGDFDSNGRLDIVVVNYNSNNIGVFLGYGNGSFNNMVTYSTNDNSGLTCVAVGYFDNDKHLDIATANWNTNNVGILLGYGNGTFTTIKIYSTGSGSMPECISIGDFNNDNKSDIAVANSGTNSIVVLFGLGDGTFLLGTAYSTDTDSSPYAVATGDFNNDTQLDIAVANRHSNKIGIFLGYGSQLFAGVTIYSTGDTSRPHSVATGDFNNDGRLDIVVANYGTDNVGVFLGRSTGAFDPIMLYSSGNGSAPYCVAVADLNNDTRLDIVVSNSGTDNIGILFGLANGTFLTMIPYLTGTGSHPYTIAISDFNNDKVLDIVVANSGTGNIYLLYGYGNGIFGNETLIPLGYGYEPYSVAVTDLNNDNWIDIVIACYGTNHIETLIKMC